MGLFNLLGGGISFGTDARTGTSALADSKYKTGLFRYPIDLGAADKGHYILININEQINTSFPGTKVESALPSVLANKKLVSSQFGGYDTAAGLANASKLAQAATDAVLSTSVGQVVKSAVNFVGSIAPEGVKDVTGAGLDAIKAVASNIDENIGVRTIRRITDTVALYMPSTLNFSYNQGYSQVSPGGSMAQTGLSMLNSATETYRNSGNKADAAAITKNLSPFLFNYLAQQVPGGVGQIMFTAGSGGKVQNPMLEILYSSPEFRTFRFDFLMFARSEVEALEVQKIIDLLRFHQAPELVKNSGGYFLYPPSEFDIAFYYNGLVNPNIPKISTCVLTSIETDYAPGGFATYEVEGESLPRMGRTGMPVGIRLSLSFKETEYLVKGSPLLPNIRAGTTTTPFQGVPSGAQM
jgi:hypothetical protein